MPLTVAPPPRTGDAAQGPLFTDSSRSVVPDHTTPEPAEPATEPAHPKPAATARTVAAGVLFAALGALLAASAVLVITAVRLFGSGDARLDLGGPPAVVLAVAFAAGNVAALLFLTRDWGPPRVVTAALAFVVAMAWPLSGIPLPAALLAIVAIGLALGRDRRVVGGRRVTGWGPLGALAAAGVTLAIAGAALAESHPVKPPTPAAPTGVKDAGTSSAGASEREGDKSTSGAADGESDTGASEAPLGGADLSDALGDAPNGATGKADPSGSTGSSGESGPTGATGEADPSGETGEAGPSQAATNDAAGDTAPNDVTPTAPAGKAPAAAEAQSSESDSASLAEAPGATLADPTSFIRAYYRALDEKRFDEAWNSLSPAVRKRFGGFGGWKAGYGTTLYSKPRTFTVTAAESGATVKHLLIARDTNCTGERRFSVTWTLRRVSEQWSVIGLTAAAVGANAAKCR